MSEKIVIRNLYKIFGATPQAALQQVLSGVGKPELLEQHGHVLGLRDINVRMMDGEITVIMGLSGSGKSTLIRHLNRLIEPTSGEVEVDGEDVLDYGPERLRQLRQSQMSYKMLDWRRELAVRLNRRLTRKPSAGWNESGWRVMRTIFHTSYPAACSSA